MIKRIIFLVGTRFSPRDYQRFGIELLQKNGFDVEVWDPTPFLHPKLLQECSYLGMFNYDGLTLFTDRIKLYSKLSKLSRADFVIVSVGYNFLTLGIFRSLSKSSADYAVYSTNISPEPVVKEKLQYLLVKKIKGLARYMYLETWKNLFMKLPARYLKVKPAKVVLTRGDKYFVYKYPVGKSTRVLQAHALDYDLYLKEKDKNCTEKAIAVFLDEFLPFHPDYFIVRSKPFVVADRYYPLLNEFFDRVEKETGLEVVIAAHPRSNYEDLPDYFKGRKCIRGKTINLVKECKLVLAHCSTSLNFANLFNKPIAFITCRDLDKTYEGLYIRGLTEWFGKKPIFIDEKNNSIDWERELKVDKDYYDDFRRSYIKTEKSEDLPFWQIVANSIKKGF